MKLDCVRPTQSNDIQIIHRDVGLKFFCLFITMFVCYYCHIRIFYKLM